MSRRLGRRSVVPDWAERTFLGRCPSLWLRGGAGGGVGVLWPSMLAQEVSFFSFTSFEKVLQILVGKRARVLSFLFDFVWRAPEAAAAAAAALVLERVGWHSRPHFFEGGTPLHLSSRQN